MTFQVARVNEALGSVSQMVENGNKLVFDKVAVEWTRLTSNTSWT